jgi:glucose/arabinose dehydrogenase
VVLLGVSARAQAQTFVDPQFVTETVAVLPPYTPVGLTFAPDGRLFVWLKGGVVRIVKNGALLPTPFLDIQAQVNQCQDRGLLGLALDPNFASNHFVYLFRTVEAGGDPNDCGPKTSRLSRVTADPANPDVVLAGSEVVIIDNIPSDSMSHSVGTLRFAPDGKLFVSHGDGAAFDFVDPLALRAQDLSQYNGKILRINPDGSAPGDNPFDDGTNSIRSKVWAYGLRNPFRFALHPATGEPWIGDVGWNDREEINRGRGANFGWPCYEGDGPQEFYQAAFVQCQQLAPSAVTPPLINYTHDEGKAVIGGTFYTGFQYPALYRNNFFFADYVANWIKRLVVDGGGVVTSTEMFATGFAGPVGIEMGPDGLLYYLEILSGVVGRIRSTVARPPTARASAKPSAGYSPLAVNFSSAGSVDPDGGALSYAWDFGDGATSTATNPQHTYVASGVAHFTATLTVTDASAATASAQVPVTVGSLPPVATIATPSGGTMVQPGQVVTYAGSATDPDDGALPATALSWTILLHHNEHVHPFQALTGAGGSFTVTSHGVGQFGFEIILTATDSSGLTDTKSVFLPMPAVGTPDVVAAYSFNEGSGSVLGDSSGNGNAGTITGAVWTSQAVFGSALTFDGVNAFVTIPDSATLDLGTTGTIEAWVRLAALNRGHGVVGKINGTLDAQQNYSLTITSTNHVACGLGNGTTSIEVISTATMTAGQFRHLACTWDGTTLTVYIDGVPDGSIPQTLTPAGNTSPLFIGQSGGVDRLSGVVDEVRVYNRALNQAELQFDMNTPIVNTTNTPPTISAIAAQVTNEDTPTGAIPFTVGDAETAPGSLTVTGGSSNVGLVPVGNIGFGGSGANRTVTVTPAANQNGTATITVTVSDGLATASTSFALTVNAVNDAPTITSIANQTTTVGVAVGPLNFTVGDVETAAASLTVSGGSSNPTLVPVANIGFGGSGASRTVTVTPAAGQTGGATITVTVSDGQLTTSTSFALTVNANASPDVTISKAHSGNFIQGQLGASYTITVSNVGTAATNGSTVTVTDTLPGALSATGLNGSGWSCTLGTLTCTRSDVLVGGSNYPTITLTVNVAGNAPSSVTNTATVSGGGDGTAANNIATDPTAIVAVVSPNRRDFNGDGKADILWRDTSGTVAMWFLNGASVIGAGFPGNASTEWTIAGVGDFNGDGKADILWRDTSGTVAVWFLNGASVIGSGTLGNVATAWSIVGVGDFNGDGKADILWRHTSGTVAVWLLNGATVIASGSPGSVAATWHVQ